MIDPRGHRRFRAELSDRLRRDVLGPVGGDDEILTEEPATAYITGVLYPSKRAQEAEDRARREQDIDLASATLGPDEVPDTGVAMANRQRPSAMGLTFAVDTAVSKTVLVMARAARYEPVRADGSPAPARRPERRGSDMHDDLRWRRRAVTAEPVVVNLDQPDRPGPELTGIPGLELRLRVRDPDPTGTVSITVTLVNVTESNAEDLDDAYCFFQPELRIATPEGKAGLVDRGHFATGGDPEVVLSRLLFRHAPTFATGHGCAAAWNWSAPEPRGRRDTARPTTHEVWTDFVPASEVVLTDSNPDIDEPAMLWLAEAPDVELFRRLETLVSGYRDWIGERSADAAGLHGPELEKVAEQQLKSCDEAAGRMAGGIERLRTDPDALTAFRLTNRAMAMQRARTTWIRSGGDGEPDLAAPRWRPFQIGFLLLCLDGIADDRHHDRGLADVLWFPTGGGKTEAYLGLIAFTTFLRRLRASRADAVHTGGGVTVLMRYTLRLLTLQQFERAATLICAMERMRETDRTRLGPDRISIGMWVGRAATPNKLDEAKDSLDELRKGKRLREMNPVQLRACPWCGTSMDYDNYRVDVQAGTMSIICGRVGCEFHGGLPVHVVDQDIYAVRPTLVIATADKFAQIAWREQVAELFNRADAAVGTPPPSLIIQDELHLISGPLGTLAGLYETAVDIATDRPKIIASTATIRRAEDQGLRLFDREVRQFPPAGIDARDSWFAVERTGDTKSSRLYVGLLTPTTSQATLLIRAYSALLHNVATIAADDRVRDAYWTLIGYFNSLRLLSAAELQVHADVNERLKQLAVRDRTEPREVDVLRELTSRVDSSEIPTYLKELFIGLPNRSTVDVVLATNMISVGVDVDRLGLMTVMGQPQTTAEYIQSTSRVGRRDPGLVVVLLNSARSRDRSHYENFVSYHSALYRQVESTSVTPFAARARDRALHAVLVGLARMLYPIARANAAAGDVDKFVDELGELKTRIIDRIRRVMPEEADRTATEIDDFIDGWRDLAASGSLLYEAPSKAWPGQQRQPGVALLSAYGQDEDLYEAAPTMWSLRDVDVESDLYLEK